MSCFIFIFLLQVKNFDRNQHDITVLESVIICTFLKIKIFRYGSNLPNCAKMQLNESANEQLHILQLRG